MKRTTEAQREERREGHPPVLASPPSVAVVHKKILRCSGFWLVISPMSQFSKLLGIAVGTAAVLGVGGALFITKTERGFQLFLDWMYQRRFADVPLISPDSLAAALATRTPPLLLDVRTPEEFAVSHLRGARRVDSDTLADLDEIDLAGTDRDQPIVAYCSIGYRSGVVARQLQELGFTNVRNLYGGIFLWHNQRRALWAGDGLTGDSLSGDSPSDNVHPYDWMWGQFVQ